MHDLAVAENGHIYQDEQGIFRFENRQHWYASPFDSVQRIILTSQVLEAESPSDDHIINVVEIKAPIREKQPLQTIYSQPSLTYIEVPANSTVSKFFEFQDPALSFTNPTNGVYFLFVANSASDESGTDRTANITFSNKGLLRELLNTT